MRIAVRTLAAGSVESRHRRRLYDRSRMPDDRRRETVAGRRRLQRRTALDAGMEITGIERVAGGGGVDDLRDAERRNVSMMRLVVHKRRSAAVLDGDFAHAELG